MTQRKSYKSGCASGKTDGLRKIGLDWKGFILQVNWDFYARFRICLQVRFMLIVEFWTAFIKLHVPCLSFFGWELWQLTSKLQTRKLKICWLWIPFTNRWWWSIASSYNRRIYFIESGAKNIDKGKIGQRHCVFNPYWVKLRHETCPKFYTAKILGSKFFTKIECKTRHFQMNWGGMWCQISSMSWTASFQLFKMSTAGLSC